jgi:hypothetical protein
MYTDPEPAGLAFGLPICERWICTGPYFTAGVVAETEFLPESEPIPIEAQGTLDIGDHQHGGGGVGLLGSDVEASQVRLKGDESSGNSSQVKYETQERWKQGCKSRSYFCFPEFHIRFSEAPYEKQFSRKSQKRGRWNQ